jgi:hypothetical protein
MRRRQVLKYGVIGIGSIAPLTAPRLVGASTRVTPTSITVSNVTVPLGTNATITALVRGGMDGITPVSSGHVSFVYYWDANNGNPNRFTVPIVNGVATGTFDSSRSAAGNWEFVIGWPTGPNGWETPSVSATGTVIITPITPTITVQPVSAVGTPTTVSALATLSNIPGIAVNNGRVVFSLLDRWNSVLAKAAATAVRNAQAQTTLSYPPGLAPGTYTIEAYLQPSAHFFNATSATGTLTVQE